MTLFLIRLRIKKSRKIKKTIKNNKICLNENRSNIDLSQLKYFVKIFITIDYKKRLKLMKTNEKLMKFLIKQFFIYFN